MEYNQEQIQAITHADGPCLVLAGPGSGKTAVITKRIEYLIKNKSVKPEKILVVTFTRAAAGEMRNRFEKMTGARYRGVSFGTFHSIFFTILKHAYHYTAANIAKEDVKYQFLKEIIIKNHVECEDENDFCTQILGEISTVKNGGIEVNNYYPVHCGKEVFQRIYHEYERYMWEHRLLDFDDILVYTKELLEQREDYRKAWQQRFSYIMVDEFQDINYLQYCVIRMLSAATDNLFAVGDDDQSIYHFRGSKPELMLHFPDDYPKAQQIALSMNYRCPMEVIEKAGKVICHNEKRFPKQIQGCGELGNTVKVRQFMSVKEENQAMIEHIRKLQAEGKDFKEIAILYRTNIQPGAMIAKLMEYNLPFQMKEQIPNLYDHWIAKDIKTYFILALGNRDRKHVLRIMNRPNRYLSRDSLPGSQVDFDKWQEFYTEQYWIAERIEKLECDIKIISRISPYAAVNYIRNGMGYDEYLADYAGIRQIPLEECVDVLEELQESMRNYKKLEDWLEFTEQYTKELKEKKERQRKQVQTESAISILTMHGAKGLEFDTVFMPDLNEGLIPYKKAVLEEEIEEERRLFYVGMTRAKKELHLYYVKQLRNKDAEPSHFLLEALEERRE